jgi:hypothetical protein
VDPRLVAELGRRQHGLVTFSQLGRDRFATDHAVASGRLEPVRRGVYRIAGTPPTWEQRVMAAVLAIPASRASHRTAARLFGLEAFAGDMVEVTVRGRQRTRRAGVVIHDTAVVGPLHGDIALGIPCMSPARTLCDLTAITDSWTVEPAVDEALRKRIVTVRGLATVFADLEQRGRRRSTVMREILEARAGAVGAGESHPEVRVSKLIVAAGLPAPTQQHRVRVGGRTARLDLAYPDLLIAVEYDGWAFHASRSAFDRDRAHANELELLGWLVLRFTSNSSDTAIVQTIRRAIARRSGS